MLLVLALLFLLIHILLVAGMFSPPGPAIAHALPRLHPARFTPARIYRAILVSGCLAPG
ncbi:MAG: hypothetical protein ACJ8J0_01495 [Longimicrobiaceae bacterium]